MKGPRVVCLGKETTSGQAQPGRVAAAAGSYNLTGCPVVSIWWPGRSCAPSGVTALESSLTLSQLFLTCAVGHSCTHFTYPVPRQENYVSFSLVLDIQAVP